MKICCLISGGKDGFMTMFHSILQGHDIACLANLSPQRDESDSFMFQSVGHDIIQYYSDAIGIPLETRKLLGSSLVLDMHYSTTKNDEVEDLFELLSYIKSKYNIDAISTGAILSSYQRIRVEHVCQRLGLVSLAYLWQRNQSELLHEMIDFDMNAIIVKVACAGLNARHLGKSIAQLEPHLLKLNELYGAHVCGEGGEFETMVLDCPFFKKRIEIVDCEQVVHSDDDFAPTVYLKIKEAKLVDKDEKLMEKHSRLIKEKQTMIAQLAQSRTCISVGPPAGQIQSVSPDGQSCPPAGQIQSNSPVGQSCPPIAQSQSDSPVDKTLQAIARIELDEKAFKINFNESDSALYFTAQGSDQQIREILDELMKNLSKFSYESKDIVQMNLFVQDMSRFTWINQVYSDFFKTNPPTRVTVASNGIFYMDGLAVKNMNPQALHVQSISYWAPANIGPYSQAVQTTKCTWMAGQIGLIPESMKLAKDDLKMSIRNVMQVAKLYSTNYLSCICYIVDKENISSAKQAWATVSNVPLLIIVVPSLPKDSNYEWAPILCDDLPVVKTRTLMYQSININITSIRSKQVECTTTLFKSKEIPTQTEIMDAIQYWKRSTSNIGLIRIYSTVPVPDSIPVIALDESFLGIWTFSLKDS